MADNDKLINNIMLKINDKHTSKDTLERVYDILNTYKVVTITFGEVSITHVGMKEDGVKLKHGLTPEELLKTQKLFNDKGCITEYVRLNDFLPPGVNAEEAAVLIIRNGIDYILGEGGADKLLDEQLKQVFDKKYKDTRRNKVLNNRARLKLTFGETNREPDYEEGYGRVVAFDDVPLTNKIRKAIPEYIQPKSKTENLKAESNYYFDKKCYIGYHGDKERRIVIAFRLGSPMYIVYNWFINNKPIGEQYKTILNGGDFYIMSEKATGHDWKQTVKSKDWKKELMDPNDRYLPTLRHAAGPESFVKKLPKEL